MNTDRGIPFQGPSFSSFVQLYHHLSEFCATAQGLLPVIQPQKRDGRGEKFPFADSAFIASLRFSLVWSFGCGSAAPGPYAVPISSQ
jgi:hypothetical protein